MYHPYCHSPSALTEYLKQKLHHQRAKHLGRSPSAQVKQNVPLKRNTPTHHTASISTITASLNPVVSLQGTLPLDPPVDMSVNAIVTTPAPLNGLKGIAPAIFNGNQSHAENFLNQFCQYKLLNQNNESFSVLFYRVLTALSYIQGPIIKDWVNTQDKWLETQVNPAKRGHVTKTNEVLWDEFKASSRSAWHDTAKTQNAYDQLMKLIMQGYNVDACNAMFERLTTAAEWELDTKGTITCY